MRHWLAIFLLCVLSVEAMAEVPVPPLETHVTDLTGTLTGQQQSALESRLAEFEQQKGSQIAVLIVPTTQPEDIAQYSIRVVEQWKLGRKGVDDGVLLLVAKNDRKLRIEVGYGLEGALNDVTSKRIIEEFIVPRFKQGDFPGGISAGVDRIIAVVSGESLPVPAQRDGNASHVLNSDLPGILFFGAMVFFLLGTALRVLFGDFAGAAINGGLVGTLVWFFTASLVFAIGTGFIMFIMTLMDLGSGRGGYSGGGGFSSGGGGGGFSGGGGSFGGGGASGSW